MTRRCPYCGLSVDYANHLGTCAAVRFALDPKYTPYSGNLASSEAAGPNGLRAETKPCARPNCREPRMANVPYCRAHRNEIVRKSWAKHKDKNNARERAKYAAQKGTR